MIYIKRFILLKEICFKESAYMVWELASLRSVASELHTCIGADARVFSRNSAFVFKTVSLLDKAHPHYFRQSP